MSQSLVFIPGNPLCSGCLVKFFTQPSLTGRCSKEEVSPSSKRIPGLTSIWALITLDSFSLALSNIYCRELPRANDIYTSLFTMVFIY